MPTLTMRTRWLRRWPTSLRWTRCCSEGEIALLRSSQSARFAATRRRAAACRAMAARGAVGVRGRARATWRGRDQCDVRTGDTHEVHERAASRQPRAGQLICARPVPAGDTHGVLSAGSSRSRCTSVPCWIELLDDEPDPVTLVAQLELAGSRRRQTSTLRATRWQSARPAQPTIRLTRARFDGSTIGRTARSRRGGSNTNTNDGMLRVRATLVLDGDTLRVEATASRGPDRAGHADPPRPGDDGDDDRPLRTRASRRAGRADASYRRRARPTLLQPLSYAALR